VVPTMMSSVAVVVLSGSAASCRRRQATQTRQVMPQSRVLLLLLPLPLLFCSPRAAEQQVQHMQRLMLTTLQLRMQRLQSHCSICPASSAATHASCTMQQQQHHHHSK